MSIGKRCFAARTPFNPPAPANPRRTSVFVCVDRAQRLARLRLLHRLGAQAAHERAQLAAVDGAVAVQVHQVERLRHLRRLPLGHAERLWLEARRLCVRQQKERAQRRGGIAAARAEAAVAAALQRAHHAVQRGGGVHGAEHAPYAVERVFGHEDGRVAGLGRERELDERVGGQADAKRRRKGDQKKNDVRDCAVWIVRELNRICGEQRILFSLPQRNALRVNTNQPQENAARTLREDDVGGESASRPRKHKTGTRTFPGRGTTSPSPAS